MYDTVEHAHVAHACRYDLGNDAEFMIIMINWRLMMFSEVAMKLFTYLSCVV